MRAWVRVAVRVCVAAGLQQRKEGSRLTYLSNGRQANLTGETERDQVHARMMRRYGASAGADREMRYA